MNTERVRTQAGDLPSAEPVRPVPLHEFVKRQVSEAILMGRYLPGTQLPSEIALAKRYGVAVGTMRRALTDLAAEGVLARRRKTGTVVTGRPPHHSLRLFFQYFRLHDREGRLQRSRTEILDVRRLGASAAEAAGLGLGAGAPLIRLDRLRRIAGRPVMHESLLMPDARVPDFPTAPGDVPELLYLYLLERYGIRISAVRETVTAEAARALDRRRLGLTSRAAVLVIADVAFDQAGRPTILAEHRASTAEHCYVNEIR